MEIMGIVAFSVASCSLFFAIIAYEKYGALEKKLNELEDKINEK